MANINAKYKIYENGVWNVYHFETDASQIKSGTLASARLPSTLNQDTTGNAATATKLKSILTTFSGSYPLTVNVNGTIYSHSNITYTGSTGILAAPVFAEGGTSLTDKYAAKSHTHTYASITGKPTLATVATSGSYNDLSNTPTTIENKNIIGSTQSVYNIQDKKVWFQKGALFYGTALDAGLVTRGISGVTTAGSSKDHLYLNYDGDDDYLRKVVLGAGSSGSDLGNGLYSYAAARGDAVKAYADANYAPKSHTHDYATATTPGLVRISVSGTTVNIITS